MNKIVNGVANDYEFPFLEKTAENYYQVMNRYYTEEFVKQLQQELQRKDNEIKQLREDIVNHIKIASEYKEQMIIKDNIIKEIKKFIEFHYTDNIDFYKNKGIGLDYPQVDYILDKIKELVDET